MFFFVRGVRLFPQIIVKCGFFDFRRARFGFVAFVRRFRHHPFLRGEILSIRLERVCQICRGARGERMIRTEMMCDGAHAKRGAAPGRRGVVHRRKAAGKQERAFDHALCVAAGGAHGAGVLQNAQRAGVGPEAQKRRGLVGKEHGAKGALLRDERVFQMGNDGGSILRGKRLDLRTNHAAIFRKKSSVRRVTPPNPVQKAIQKRRIGRVISKLVVHDRFSHVHDFKKIISVRADAVNSVPCAKKSLCYNIGNSICGMTRRRKIHFSIRRAFLWLATFPN